MKFTNLMQSKKHSIHFYLEYLPLLPSPLLLMYAAAAAAAPFFHFCRSFNFYMLLLPLLLLRSVLHEREIFIFPADLLCCLTHQKETHDKTIILNAQHRNKFVKETQRKRFKVSKRNHTENYRVCIRIYASACSCALCMSACDTPELGIAPGSNNSSLA